MTKDAVVVMTDAAAAAAVVVTVSGDEELLLFDVRRNADVCCCCWWWLRFINDNGSGDDDGDDFDEFCSLFPSSSSSFDVCFGLLLSLLISFVISTGGDPFDRFDFGDDVDDCFSLLTLSFVDVVVANVDDDDGVDRLLFVDWFNGWFDIIDAKCDVRCAVHADSFNVCGWCDDDDDDDGTDPWCWCRWLKWPILFIYWWCVVGDRFRFLIPLLLLMLDVW